MKLDPDHKDVIRAKMLSSWERDLRPTISIDAFLFGHLFPYLEPVHIVYCQKGKEQFILVDRLAAIKKVKEQHHYALLL